MREQYSGVQLHISQKPPHIQIQCDHSRKTVGAQSRSTVFHFLYQMLSSLSEAVSEYFQFLDPLFCRQLHLSIPQSYVIHKRQRYNIGTVLFFPLMLANGADGFKAGCVISPSWGSSNRTAKWSSHSKEPASPC